MRAFLDVFERLTLRNEDADLLKHIAALLTKDAYPDTRYHELIVQRA